MSERLSVFFIVPGDPQSKQRPRTVRLPSGRSNTFTPRETLDAEKIVATHYRQKSRHRFEGAVTVDIRFSSATNRPRDLDNMAKLVLDALNGHAYGDDSQVTRLIVEITRGVGHSRAQTAVIVSGAR